MLLTELLLLDCPVAKALLAGLLLPERAALLLGAAGLPLRLPLAVPLEEPPPPPTPPAPPLLLPTLLALTVGLEVRAKLLL